LETVLPGRDVKVWLNFGYETGGWRLATGGWLFVVIICGEIPKIIY
jgi:hypothetical protein